MRILKDAAIIDALMLRNRTDSICLLTVLALTELDDTAYFCNSFLKFMDFITLFLDECVILLMYPVLFDYDFFNDL